MKMLRAEITRSDESELNNDASVFMEERKSLGKRFAATLAQQSQPTLFEPELDHYAKATPFAFGCCIKRSVKCRSCSAAS